MSDLASILSVTVLDPASEDTQALFASAERQLPHPDGGGRKDVRRWFVPGRIEVFGKHTDYAGGRSLLTTTAVGIAVASRPRDDDIVHVGDGVRGQAIEYSVSGTIEPPPGWGNYVATVVRRVARNLPAASRGVDIGIASSLPPAAGMSSSSALMIAIFLALADANDLLSTEPLASACPTPETLAEYIACIENGQSFRSLAGDRGVGTFGGSEDHTAILCCRSDSVCCYRFCPVIFERRVGIPLEWTLAVGSSGVTASKSGAVRERYNRLSLAARAALDEWQAASGSAAGSLGDAVRSSAAADIRRALRHSRRSDFTAAELVSRFDQFALESEVLVPAATDAFARGDRLALGDLAARSQAAAQAWLGNQVPESIALVRRARELGAFAAASFGAGFGGSVWALVERERAQTFAREWTGA